jgi:diacylglycerol kinase (ATP)
MKKEKFSLAKRLHSFKYAFNGLRTFFLQEHNARVQLVTTLLVISIGIYFNITLLEWGVLILAIGIVLVAEILNTAIEYLADHTTKDLHPEIKIVKDIAAAGVLIAAFVAFAIGLLVILPHFIR